ncbi:Na+/H+ antiporter subunit G [Bacillus sp. HNG]|uniref:monovalent cation/H(+) antiporter subunit G n=1 Tax=Bacillus sp. HNG TaxID=2293325 RepID=UPI000E2E631A|nr:monovalent cation/H(+) antiporter subunit G [Bacillus sp. HNG]RFB15118.1 Na+/H+ antiporter subunit G [Bacillus sp. HNG]
MTEMLKILFAVMILFGALLSILSAIGIVRLPDVYTRNHAVSKSATLGVLSILLGTFLYFWIIEGYMNFRVILGFVFLFMTSPVSGHLISRAAYNSKVPLWEKSARDDLKDKEKLAKENMSQ